LWLAVLFLPAVSRPSMGEIPSAEWQEGQAKHIHTEIVPKARVIIQP
jgi:hypothetical protein